jgi:hypothetical protein
VCEVRLINHQEQNHHEQNGKLTTDAPLAQPEPAPELPANPLEFDESDEA